MLSSINKFFAQDACFKNGACSARPTYNSTLTVLSKER